MKLAGFRLVVVAVFGGNYAQLDQKPARSVSSEFEDQGNVKRGDRGDFYSSACLDFAEGNPGVLERATCPDRVPFGVTSRHLVARQLFFYSRDFSLHVVDDTLFPSSSCFPSCFPPPSPPWPLDCHFRAGEMRGMRYSSLYDADARDAKTRRRSAAAWAA